MRFGRELDVPVPTDDFTEFQYGKTYEIYNKKATDVTFSITGKSPGPNVSHSIKLNDNFISPAVKTATNVTVVLSGLTQGTDYSDVKRFNATTQTWESFASNDFTQFEPGKGYNIIGLQNASFSYGSTQQTTDFVYDSTGSRVKKTIGSTTTVYLGKDYEVEGSTSTKYVFLGDRRISSKDLPFFASIFFALAGWLPWTNRKPFVIEQNPSKKPEKVYIGVFLRFFFIIFCLLLSTIIGFSLGMRSLPANNIANIGALLTKPNRF